MTLKDLNAKPVHTSSTNGPPRRHAHRPARAGNLTVPPYEVEHAGPDGVTATVRFRVFHLGGNGVAHGGQVAVAFDDLGGMASAVAVHGVCRTAT